MIGAYPNAIIQSAVGEEIQTSNGTLKPLNGKQDLSKNDIIFGYSTNGSINLLYKELMEKGGKEDMENDEAEATELNNENVETVEEVIETAPEVNVEENTLNNEEVEVNETTTETEETEGEATGETLYTEKDVLEKFENICNSVDELVELAKEGLENRKEVISEALNSGVHAMGNAFNKDIFSKTFSNMKTKDIQEMGKAWENQAKAQFGNEKVSKVNIEQTEEEFKRVGLKQFKTGNY